MLPLKAFLLTLLSLSSVLGHSHHHDDDDEIVPEDRREELLKKWEQEVNFDFFHSHILYTIHTNPDYSGVSLAFQRLRT
jgi:hypothetical protein